MRTLKKVACAAVFSALGAMSPMILAGEAQTPAPSGDSCPACASAAPALAHPSAAFQQIKQLAGTWVGSAAGMGAGPVTFTFHPTANGTAVLETLFAGTDHEMLDLYTPRSDGGLIVTHYCSLGQQPRMQLKPSLDATLHFAFIDGGNIASVSDPHMASVDLTIKGEQLTENWSLEASGKVLKRVTLELHRQTPEASARQ
jgi:hypothetical protein